MKIIIEVVVTNVDTGHIAINQKMVEIFPAIHKQEQIKRELKAAGETPAEKVGPMLISRSYTVIED